MKRWTALLLMLGLLTGPGLPAILAESEIVHTLWHIPFDISMEECKRLLEAKTDARYVLDRESDTPRLETAPGNPVTFLDLPATVQTFWQGDEPLLGTIVLQYDLHSIPHDDPDGRLADTASGMLARFEDLRQALDAQYGPCTGMELAFPPDPAETELIAPRLVPMKGDAIDYDEVLWFTLHTRVEVYLDVYWNNICLRYYSNPYGDTMRSLTLDVRFSNWQYRSPQEHFREYVRPEV